MYEGAPVFVDHADGKKRTYKELIGNVKNVRVECGSLYGDVTLNPAKPIAEAVWWDFLNNTKGIGMSHSIEGDVKDGNVTSITKVHSVDVVFDPATTVSLKEEADEYDQKHNDAIDGLGKRMDEHKSRLDEHHDRISAMESKVKEEQAELKAANDRLISEIIELKGKLTSKPLSRIPLPSASKPEEDLHNFVQRIKGR